MPRRRDRTAPAQTAAAQELEERFAREYVVDLSAAAAYRRCRPDVTDGTARVEGCKMLARPRVQQLVEELQARILAKLDVRAEDVLRELALVGFSDVRHYQVNPVTGALELAPDVPEDRGRAVASVKHRTVHTGEGERARVEYVTELRLWPKVEALTRLGEHLKLWKGDPADRGRTEVVIEPDGSVRIITGDGA